MTNAGGPEEEKKLQVDDGATAIPRRPNRGSLDNLPENSGLCCLPPYAYRYRAGLNTNLEFWESSQDGIMCVFGVPILDFVYHQP
jgi:hypothetical protein